MKHFLQETDFSHDEVLEIFSKAFQFKENRQKRPSSELAGESWGMLFYKNSTRTRVSFEVGIRELGGHPVTLNQENTQIGRGESIEDTIKVLSRFLDGLILRTHGHEIIQEFARHSNIPIVNALSDFLHPCQIFADCMTILEKTNESCNPFSGLRGVKLAFLGDTSCNMANSWILAGSIMGMDISLGGPKEFKPSDEIIHFCQKNHLEQRWSFTNDARDAVKNADVVYTDVWVSMGCEKESEERLAQMNPFRVDQSILSHAKKNALFMHCMPAHPGEEVSQEVLNSPQAILFDQAENRLHIQKAILAKLANK
tara:strand:- start:14531 stop:15466 length:936 start_codon:yes stop_codon:yes gene_type:complete